MKSLRELVRMGLIMADKRKLQRIPMVQKYTTGDAQDWTYEYTREDFDAACINNVANSPNGIS